MRIARFLSAVVLTSGIILLPLIVVAQTTEQIALFNESVLVNTDGTIIVDETISYDFGSNDRHGIFRDIPKTFTDASGANRSLAFSDISVVDESGTQSQIELSDIGDYYRIRIGNPDQTVTGLHTYDIRYRVDGAILYAKEFDELYWNVTGNKWEVPIGRATASVLMPQGAVIKQYSCYEGMAGSKHPCGSKSYASSTEAQNNPVLFASTGSLKPGSGLTVGVGIVKGTITQANPLPEKPSMEGVYDTSLWEIALGALLPLIAFLVCFYIWWRIGRDPKENTVIAEYEAPKGMSVFEMSAVLHPFSPGKDISAAVLSLASQGAFTISPVETTSLMVFHKKDYRLTEEGGREALQNDLDQRLYDALFEDALIEAGDTKKSILVSLIDKASMAKSQKSLRSDATKRLVEAGYYTRNPEKMRGLFIAAAFILGFGSIFLFGSFMSIPILLGAFAAAVIIALFSFIIPQMTEKGASLHRQLFGLKLYLSVAEKDRITFHNAPERTPQLFERLLPYAMLFGVVSIWVKEFEGIAQMPSYYHSNAGAWSAVAFASDMNSFSSSLAAVSVSSSGSGGGGFSGGGGGGGGGGSW